MTYWLIYFEDRDMDVEIFTDESVALEVFAERSANWNCVLFKSVYANYHN